MLHISAIFFHCSIRWQTLYFHTPLLLLWKLIYSFYLWKSFQENFGKLSTFLYYFTSIFSAKKRTFSINFQWTIFSFSVSATFRPTTAGYELLMICVFLANILLLLILLHTFFFYSISLTLFIHLFCIFLAFHSFCWCLISFFS